MPAFEKTGAAMPRASVRFDRPEKFDGGTVSTVSRGCSVVLHRRLTEEHPD